MAKDFPQGGVAYEPRSFWSARTFSTGSQGGEPGISRPVLEFNFNREHFRNGTRWPVELRRIAVCPINYPFQDGYDTTLFGADASLSVINKMTVRIGVPYRQRYMRENFNLASMCPRPTAEPAMPSTSRSATLWGVCRMKIDEDRPLIIPKNATMETQFTGPGRFDRGFPPAVTFPSDDLPTIPATVAWLERGGLLPGDARSKRFDLTVARYANAPSSLGGNGLNNDTNDNMPYGVPASLDYPAEGVGLGNQGFWQAANQISGREWDQQEATRSGSTRIDSGVIGFDQWLYDEDCGAVADIGPGRFSHLATRIGSKIKLFNCGSNAWWWRPGAPLALTFDHITPANVYELPQPIVLSPGDALDVSVTIPAALYGQQWGIQPPPQPAGPGAFPNYAERYQFGISFNGYAAIES